ncbi:carboxymuconolactone decarboxylase family protein [Cricetibacter osteomyelitidis]|uniref:Carboxymuconolactone decarboxylase family protein n=1 Tax=Cricetibacter osteomyelitidis TaxID=1521931 RepID=A0A4R2SZM0_9PAST|nr:carboxymuconolactone decarboxylase family protein [Cricetibacter osteomyelitidis]TCP95987.1 carboxymuconolactone decarboxylase family protein [Cricetibacter osteomyelitidis]
MNTTTPFKILQNTTALLVLAAVVGGASFQTTLAQARTAAAISQEQSMNELNQTQQSLALIGKYVATGNQAELKNVLNQTFDRKALTINQAKDAIVQLYAYCGFPRALNGLATLQSVVNERQEQGLNTEIGRKVTALSADFDSLKAGQKTQTELTGREVKGGIFDFAPDINRYLQAHLFGDVFTSDLLSWQQREVLILGALGANADTASQYNAHKNIGKHNGLTDGQINAIETLVK